MKKKIAGLIVIAMALSLTTSVAASSNNENENYVKNRIQSYVQEKISTTDSTITTSKSKTLHDFAGNRYELVECNPTGYFIIHPKSGITVEYSTEDKSPYEGYDSNLYYGGPTYYYVKSNNSYVHTIDGTSITNIKGAASFCNVTEKKLESNADLNAQEFLIGKTSSLQKNSIQSTSAIDFTDYWIKHPEFFDGRENGFGFVSGGYCGYIAANFILKYWWAYSSISIDYPYYICDDTSLTNKLIDIGGGGAGSAYSLTSTINTFASQQGIPQCATCHLGVAGVVNEIQNCKRPVILIGNLPGAGDHDVVCYGFNKWEADHKYTFICHYGWNNRCSNVHVSGTGDTLFYGNCQYNLPDQYQY